MRDVALADLGLRVLLAYRPSLYRLFESVTDRALAAWMAERFADEIVRLAGGLKYLERDPKKAGLAHSSPPQGRF